MGTTEGGISDRLQRGLGESFLGCHYRPGGDASQSTAGAGLGPFTRTPRTPAPMYAPRSAGMGRSVGALFLALRRAAGFGEVLVKGWFVAAFIFHARVPASLCRGGRRGRGSPAPPCAWVRAARQPSSSAPCPYCTPGCWLCCFYSP